MALLLEVNGDDDAELRIAIASQTLTGPMYGGHGEAGHHLLRQIALR
jgi:hypothetical protein